MVSQAGFSPWAIVWTLETSALDGSISLKFLLETRLECESFEPLIDFLGFQVQKLWPKNNKIIN